MITVITKNGKRFPVEELKRLLQNRVKRTSPTECASNPPALSERRYLDALEKWSSK